MGFDMPPSQRNAGGEWRRVGFEMEFSGLDLDGAAAVIADLFGGDRIVDNPFVQRLEKTRLGDFELELDASLLKQRRYAEALKKLGFDPDDDPFGAKLEKAIGNLAATVVPYEIVTPPVPLDQLDEIERLRQALHERGAKGTRASPLHAFGCHINPEAPSLEAASLLAHLRAFLLLFEKLRDSAQVDFSRRVAPFIDPFPEAYRDRVLDAAYAPDCRALAADYVAYNPTRNRPLDLLPLLAHVCGPEAVAGADGGKPVGARPAYHYRMPDCAIGDPHWRVAAEWNRWIQIERLAADGERLEALCAAATEG